MDISTPRPRRSLLALALLLAGATSALALNLWPEALPKQPTLYVIHGFLDEAPKGARVIDQIEIVADGREPRKLVIGGYANADQERIDVQLSRAMRPVYSITGKKDDVARLIDAPKGAQVEGLFIAYTDGMPSLAIGKLDLPAAPGATSAAD